LKVLTLVAAWCVWLLVAVLIILAIFRLASIYIGAIDAAANGIF
jgi:hypothetical protein